uniref:Uncharacterized protein n=1 Tax=Arundo donax TaxID=35708 RepID=A0A0A9A6H4_ARUDO
MRATTALAGRYRLLSALPRHPSPCLTFNTINLVAASPPC